MITEVPEISVIVPVYNVEQFLFRCLDSIFQQQFSGTYEVIAVDDCSTDGSLNLLYNYKKKEPGLIIIQHPQNRKLSVARHTGIKSARGEYIMHVDSDDWLLPDAFEDLHRKCKETDADVVVFNYRTEDSNGQHCMINSIKSEMLTQDKNLVHPVFLGAPWNKIVKKNFVEGMISGEVGINSAEDLLYSSEILLRVSTIGLTTKAYYNYFVNNSSITRTVSSINYLIGQKPVLKQLDNILFANKATGLFIDTVLCHFEKYIYLEICRIHFLSKGERSGTFLKGFLEDFGNVAIVSDIRLKRLKRAINYVFFSLYEVGRRLGYKMAFSILVRNFKLKVNPKNTEVCAE